MTAREIGRVTIAEALELTALVAWEQPHRYGRFAARWVCLYLEEHDKATLEDVALLVSNLRSLEAPKDHAGARDPEEGRPAGLIRVSRADLPVAVFRACRPPSVRGSLWDKLETCGGHDPAENADAVFTCPQQWCAADVRRGNT